MSDTAPAWYIYHEVNGEMVLDRAHHTLHIEQAHKAMGLSKPKYVAGVKTPLTQVEAERYAKGAGLKLNLSPRKALPEFVEPAHWQSIRDRNAAATKRNEAGKKSGH
jgi:hypothetical protein